MFMCKNDAITDIVCIYRRRHYSREQELQKVNYTAKDALHLLDDRWLYCSDGWILTSSEYILDTRTCIGES